MKLSAVVLLVFASLALASFNEDWAHVRPAATSERLTFHIAMTQRNVKQLEHFLYAVSDPTSPSYGRHATIEQVNAMVAPPKKAMKAVRDFLNHHGGNHTGHKVDVVEFADTFKVTAPLSIINKMFGGEYHWYIHNPSQHTVIRSDEKGIAIPNEIEKYIDFVTGLVSFPIIQKQDKVKVLAEIEENAKAGAGQYNYFAPATVRMLYNIPTGTAATNPKSSQCAIEFAPEGAFVPADYVTFCRLAGEKFTNYSNIVGPFTEGAWGNTESQLDVQVLGTIGSGAQNWFWTIADGWIYEMATEIFNTATKPYVYSISYGWPEALTCNSAVVRANCNGGTNAQYIARADTELAKLGSIGLSIITCSQDEGAPSSANMGCSNTTHPVFGIYPASSPYATTVSGTTAGPEGTLSPSAVKTGANPPICTASYPCDTSKNEAPCMPTNTLFSWTTGGGFSEITPRPSFQDAFVKNYLASKAILPPTQYFWPNNRGYPDISAIGARVLIVDQGQVSVAEGTSASTPMIAGIVSLLNDYRFANNKDPLGWLNPMLYQMATAAPSAFKDITTGDNRCTEGGTCCKYGYGATTGWDAVTGLGTPNYVNMLNYVKTLP